MISESDMRVMGKTGGGDPRKTGEREGECDAALEVLLALVFIIILDTLSPGSADGALQPACQSVSCFISQSSPLSQIAS